MKQHTVLDFGQFYHIYNHGVGGRDLFREPGNYEYFLGLYDKHISPVANTYAWCLMPNHFHLLVRIKDKSEVDGNLNLTGFGNLSGLKPLHQHFSNLFNAYTKAYNKYYETKGTLFERPFKRKHINNNEYLCQAVLYIHNNPVHHGYCSHPLEYLWSSFLTCTSDKVTKLKRDEVIAWFGGKKAYEEWHKRKIDMQRMDYEMGIS